MAPLCRSSSCNTKGEATFREHGASLPLQQLQYKGRGHIQGTWRLSAAPAAPIQRERPHSGNIFRGHVGFREHIQGTYSGNIFREHIQGTYSGDMWDSGNVFREHIQGTSMIQKTFSGNIIRGHVGFREHIQGTSRIQKTYSRNIFRKRVGSREHIQGTHTGNIYREHIQRELSGRP
jgi:uncharacterized lipoprotein YmbA